MRKMDDLEKAIKLTEKCCEKKDLVVYAMEIYLTCGGGGHSDIVCTECRHDYGYEWGEDELRDYNRKLTDDMLYDKIKQSRLFLKNGVNNIPGFLKTYAKRLKLDEKKLEQIINN